MLKRTVDLVMTVLLLLLMAFQVTGQAAHERIGAAMFVLVLLHQGLNFRWYRGLFRGRYGVMRVLMTVVNLALLAAFFITAVSGAMMSQYDLAFLSVESGTAWARLAHLAGSYWSFLLVGLHLGLHWGMVASRLPQSGVRAWASRMAAVLLSGYGLRLFLVSGIPSCLFLSNQFAFLDYGKSAELVLAENLAMLSFFVLAAFQISRMLTALTAGNWREGARPALTLLAVCAAAAAFALL